MARPQSRSSLARSLPAVGLARRRLLATALLLLASYRTTRADPSLPTCAAGWKLEVVARVHHPSVVCCAPDGRIFVGEDPIDMEGPLEEPADRIVCLHPDGRRTVFAERLGPVFGMMYLEGKLYVQNVPKFSVFRDDNGIGRDRVDLIETTNPTPSAGNGLNDHIPSNFRLAMDGFLYMSVGQKGIFGALGRDGRRFEMREGGILRMRPDATGLEIHARGIRNIMDVAMNSEDEIFAYDNDDHTKTWKVKILHMVEGGYYGFPWDFKPPRPYTLGGIMTFPEGAPTGGMAYTEDALPLEYRDNLFLCDWGRRTVFRVHLARAGATYRVTSVEDLIPPGPDDFRPVGITSAPDGLSLYVSDWNFAGWKQGKEAGRLLKVTWTGSNHAAAKPDWFLPSALEGKSTALLDVLISGLSHPARSVRMTAQRRIVDRGTAAVEALAKLVCDPAAAAQARTHALWALDAIDGGIAKRTVILQALRDGNAALRRQAARQLGERRVPDALGALAELLGDPDGAVRFQAAVALGRIADPAAAPALTAALDDHDAVVRHATFTALHRIGVAHAESWAAIARGLRSDRPAVRDGTLFAMRETYEDPVVKAIDAFVRDAAAPPEARAAALGVLADLCRKPPPWDGRWWRNGPYAFAEDDPGVGPRIDKTVSWAGTPVVLGALRGLLEERSPVVRAAAIEGVRVVADRDLARTLVTQFDRETDVGVRKVILRTVAELREPGADALLRSTLTDPALRATAIVGLARIPVASGLDVYLQGLAEADPNVVEGCRRAIRALGAEGRALLRTKLSAGQVPPGAVDEARQLARAEVAPAAAAVLPREAYGVFALENRGDPVRGRALFTNRAKLTCLACHRLNGTGGEIGSDLASIGSKYQRASLIESILYPSKQIAEGNAQTLVQLTNGQVMTGLVRAETTGELVLFDGQGARHVIRAAEIESRKLSDQSPMPENLHAALTLQEFADLVAFLESLDGALGFVPLLNGKDLAGWKKDAANDGHWTVKQNGTLFYDGRGHDLWTEKSYSNFELRLDCRFPPVEAGGKAFVEKEAPVILADGSQSARTQKVLDGGDSGIFLRGSTKSQVNIWCWPIGSGDVYGYRTDRSLPPEMRAAAMPRVRADRPPGEWNRFVITMNGELLTVVLNGTTVIDRARLPGIPAKGPIGLQHPGNPLTPDMPVEFANLLIRELP